MQTYYRPFRYAYGCNQKKTFFKDDAGRIKVYSSYDAFRKNNPYKIDNGYGVMIMNHVYHDKISKITKKHTVIE